MDTGKQKITRFFRKLSPMDQIDEGNISEKLLYSVIGFLPVSDFVDNAILISNLAYHFGTQNMNVCVVDFKVFNPNLYLYVDAPAGKRGSGLLSVLKSDKVDYRDEIVRTKYDGVFLMGPSPDDLIEEYLDFKFDSIERVITGLKNMFDLVLIDIPNNPPLEFCMGAMNNCHIGFMTVSERMEAVSNVVKILNFAGSIGISTAKFTNVILVNRQDVEIDLDVFSKLNMRIIGDLPLVKGAITDVFEGKIYLKDNPRVNKSFREELNRIAEYIVKQ